MYYILKVRDREVILFLQGNILLSFGEDNSNQDWNRYQKWLEEGNIPLPWPTNEGGV